jgi:glutamate dehydrogenase (NAD(P)+)
LGGATARFLAKAGVPVAGIADAAGVVANSATNSWWWWTLFGDIEPDADDAFRKIRGNMRALVTTVLDHAEATGVTPRAAAALAALASERIADRFGHS